MKIVIIGMGYVGLPLAIEFGKKHSTLGFDINKERISDLKKGIDSTLEVLSDEFDSSKMLSFSCNDKEILGADCYIITVPTPIDEAKKPDLRPLISASETVGKSIRQGSIVIYESTVYPGATEEVCVPILEKYSKMKFNESFFVGYSPERINPGDKSRRLTDILKITSGSTPEIANRIDALYRSIITAGTYKTSSIKVAEAAKVIENTQRDVNIALVNELALIFNKVGIDTLEVLEAAGTKWNFLPFRPGLVGGHCISVDPYYLTYKAESLGYHPEIILAGRRLNDSMANFVAQEVVKLMIQKSMLVCNAKVLVLGITFKENCPDVRNSGAVNIVEELQSFGCDVSVFDQWADSKEVKKEYGLDLVESIEGEEYDAIVLAVGHDCFKEIEFKDICHEDTVIYDIKYVLDKKIVDGRL
jgi:UDP-N-acetyl-D-galactosamine dehydrogenase